MTTETSVALSPAEVLDAARDFFSGRERMADAWIDSESDTHVSFGTFRGNLSVAAFRDTPDAATRVRISTLREEGLVPRLVTHLAMITPADGRSG